MAILIKATGFILSRLPYGFLEKTTECLSAIFMLIPSPRRRVLLSNLRHAFPDWTHKKIRVVAKESAARMFEMGFFSLCYPFMSKDQLKRTVYYPKETDLKLKKLRQSGGPVLFLIPHVCLFEALATSPYFRPFGGRRIGAIYRPNKNKTLDKWINQARLRTGIDTFSRNDGFFKTKGYLKKGNWLGILFDQDAGRKGKIINFLGRACSCSSLPELLTKSADCTPVFAMPKRISFFESSLELLEVSGSSICENAHNTLKSFIENSDLGLPEWLWGHAKWKSPIHPRRIFANKFNSTFIFEKDKFKLQQKLWVRMPNWLGDIIMTLPILLTIKSIRPDIQITLLCKNVYGDLLHFLYKDFLIERIPNSIFDFILWVLPKRKEYPDLMLVFTNSLRGDIESFLTGVPFRFGVAFNQKRRPLITHLEKADEENLFNLSLSHNEQVLNWSKMIYNNGFSGKLNSTPMRINKSKSNSIGIIAGSSNNNNKCWNPSNWVSLTHKILIDNPTLKIFLFGTLKDSVITKNIKEKTNSPNVINRAGKTNLVSFAKELSDCSYVIGNDTGGVHLANCLGVSTIVLYGPTNPLKTKPVFDSPLKIIQPHDCPPSGGSSMNDLTVDQVWKEISPL